MNARAYVFVPYWLLYLNLKHWSANLSHFSNIWRAFCGILYVLEPKGGGGGRSVGLFYCLILSGYNCLQWPEKVQTITNQSSNVSWNLKILCSYSNPPPPSKIKITENISLWNDGIWLGNFVQEARDEMDQMELRISAWKSLFFFNFLNFTFSKGKCAGKLLQSDRSI
jgi:hypothetical protein